MPYLYLRRIVSLFGITLMRDSESKALYVKIGHRSPRRLCRDRAAAGSAAGTAAVRDVRAETARRQAPPGA